MKTVRWIVLPLLLMSATVHANSITTSIGDRDVTFKLIQKGSQTLLATESNELVRSPVVLNPANRKFFVEALQKACNRDEYEVNTRRYQIEINRVENGKKIHCIYGFNSTSPKARVARNAIDVLSIAVNTAESSTGSSSEAK